MRDAMWYKCEGGEPAEYGNGTPDGGPVPGEGRKVVTWEGHSVVVGEDTRVQRGGCFCFNALYTCYEYSDIFPKVKVQNNQLIQYKSDKTDAEDRMKRFKNEKL